jgi:Leucine-rich repeat (LRR) protein
MADNKFSDPIIVDENLYKKYTLDCAEQDLETLHKIKTKIKHIYCSENKLTLLPKLPDGLEELDCSENKLKKLPKLPKNLWRLFCYKNLLTWLPELPVKLEEFAYGYNKLTCLPKLPKSLWRFMSDNDNVFISDWYLDNWTLGEDLVQKKRDKIRNKRNIRSLINKF